MTFPSNELERVLAASYAGEVPGSAFVSALIDATVWVPMMTDERGGRPIGQEIEGRTRSKASSIVIAVAGTVAPDVRATKAARAA